MLGRIIKDPLKFILKFTASEPLNILNYSILPSELKLSKSELDAAVPTIPLELITTFESSSSASKTSLPKLTFIDSLYCKISGICETNVFLTDSRV